MPDVGSLYPQPPQAQQQGGSLLSNPGQAIGILQGLQNLQIQGAQAPALMQRPGVELQEAQTRLQQAKQGLDQFSNNNVNNFVASQVLGLKNPKDDQGLRAIEANTYRRFHDVDPQIVKGVIDNVRNSKDREGTARAMQASALPIEDATQQVPAPPGRAGENRVQTKADSVRAGHQQIGNQPGFENIANDRLADEAFVANHKARIQPLEKIIELSDKLGAGGTGPGSAGRQQIMAQAYTMFPGLISDAKKNQISEYDQLRKYMAQSYSQLAQGAAPHTNQGLETTITGSPNPDVTDLAVGPLAKMLVAQDKMKTAQLSYAHRKDKKTGEYVVPTKDVPGEKARVGLDMDYRAFLPHSQKELVELNKKLPQGEERNRFNRSYDYGVQGGVMPGQ